MRTFPIAPMLAFLALIVVTAPVGAGVWIARQGHAAFSESDRPAPACLPIDILCQLGWLNQNSSSQ